MEFLFYMGDVFMPINFGLLMIGTILVGLEAINDILKTISLIKLLAVFITVKPYTSKKKINTASMMSDKIENFCAPPL